MNRPVSILFVVLALGAAAATAPEVTPLGDLRDGLTAPARVAVGPGGEVYVSDPQAGTIVVFDVFGRRRETVNLPGRPLGLAVDPQGRIHVGDEASGRVGVYDGNWNLLYALGTGSNQFRLPGHIAIDSATGSNVVYVSDGLSNTVSIFDGPFLRAQFGSAGTNAGQFDFAAGVCVGPTGVVFVADQQNDRIQVFDRNGSFLQSFNLATNGAGGPVPSGRPQGLHLDAAGRLYMVDSFQAFVAVLDAQTGTILTNLGTLGGGTGQLDSPAGLALDPLGRLFVTAANNGRVERFGLDQYLHLSVLPADVITTEGTNLVFSVSGGTGLALQWRRDGTNLVDSGHVAGATASVMTVSGILSADDGAYDVVVTGASFAWTSAVTRVAVQAPPVIVGPPLSQLVLLGAPAYFSVGVTGLPVTYQWLFNDAEIDGATNTALTLAAVEEWQAGDYAVRVSNAVGVVQSPPATLTVVPVPTVMEILVYATDTDGVSRVFCDIDPFLPFALERSPDLQAWQSVTNFMTESGIFEYQEPGRDGDTNRFYRIRWRAP